MADLLYNCIVLMNESNANIVLSNELYLIKMNNILCQTEFKGMEHVPNIFMSFDKYLFLEVINILI